MSGVDAGPESPTIRGLLAGEGIVRYRLAQIEDEDIDGPILVQTPSITMNPALRELTSFRVAKAGYRKLNMREQVLLRSLMRGPSERSDDDIEVIIRATADVKFFQHLTEQQRSGVCREMTYEIVQDGETIFDQGDEGNAFYILFCGRCKLYATDEKRNWIRTCIGTLDDGASFGELALISGSAGTRSATAMAHMPTILFKVMRGSYRRTLQKLHEQDLAFCIHYFSSLYLFADWPVDSLRRLASCTTRRRYERNSTVIAQGSSSELVFFILRGRCRVIKRTTIRKEDRLMLTNNAKLPLETTRRVQRRQATVGLREEVGSSSGVATDDPGEMLLEIAEMGMYEYFGELAMLHEGGKGTHTASVVTTVPVEVCPKQAIVHGGHISMSARGTVGSTS